MTFNKKEYEKDINNACNIFTHKKTKPNIKKCSDMILNCHYNKCMDHIVAVENSKLTETDKEKCDNKNFKKYFRCTNKILTKKGYYEANAKKGHCISNKCPEVYKYFNGEMKKRISKKMSDHHKNGVSCLKKNCKKELIKLSKLPNIFEITNECSKKTDNYKEQEKCIAGKMKNYSIYGDKVNKCEQKHCKKDKNNNKLLRKSNKSIKTNKTIKSTGHK